MKKLATQHEFARLDVARGIASLAVFACHICQILFWRLTGPEDRIAIVSGIAGRHAVLIFFLLSGNLITESIKHNIRRNGQLDSSDYLASRIARIYPPFLGALFICLIVWVIVHSFGLAGAVSYGMPGDLYRVRDNLSVSPSEIVRALSMRGGLGNVDGALWSLYVEFQIYILVMAVAMLKAPRLLARIVAILLSLWMLDLLRHMLFLVAIWGLGAACSLWRPNKAFLLAITACAAAILVFFALSRPEVFKEAENAPAYLAQVLCCILYATIMFFWKSGIRYPRFMIATGNFSYSLYLTHWPLLMLALSLGQNWMGHSYVRTWAIAAPAAIIIMLITIPLAQATEQKNFFKKYLLTGR